MDVEKFGFDTVRRKVKEATGYDPDSTEAIKRRLEYIGRECCNHARLNGSYKDQTRCLRSSIGYRLFLNGEEVSSGGFEGKNPIGIEAAKEAIGRFSNETEISPLGWTLIMVAGMSYATYVEAKGYNVLSLTEIELKDRIDKLKHELGIK